jgi:hypothetical protein
MVPPLAWLRSDEGSNDGVGQTSQVSPADASTLAGHLACTFRGCVVYCAGCVRPER